MSISFTPSTSFVVFLFILSTTFALNVHIPGRCSNVCHMDIAKTFDECRRKAHLDCIMTFCAPSPSRHTSCRLRPAGPRSVKPTERVTLQNVNLTNNDEIGIIPLMLTDPDQVPIAQKNVDVYLLVDATASMGSLILSIQDGFERVLSGLTSSSNTAFGVGIFRDERELNQGFQSIQPITKDLNMVRNAIGKLEAKGGLDASEANLVALHRVATQGNQDIRWRQNSYRFILYIADNPGHEPTCREGNIWLTRQKVVETLNKSKITVIAISYPFEALNRSPSPFECQPSIKSPGGGQGSFIAQNTGGIYIGGKDTIFDADRVINIINDRLVSRIVVVKNTCWTYGDFKFQPSLPTVLGKGEKLMMSVKPKKSLCQLKPPFRCSIIFRRGAKQLAPFQLTILPPIDC